MQGRYKISDELAQRSLISFVEQRVFLGLLKADRQPNKNYSRLRLNLRSSLENDFGKFWAALACQPVAAQLQDSAALS